MMIIIIIIITIASILRFRFEKSFGVRVRIVKQKSIVNVDHIINYNKTTKSFRFRSWHFCFQKVIIILKKNIIHY